MYLRIHFTHQIQESQLITHLSPQLKIAFCKSAYLIVKILGFLLIHRGLATTTAFRTVFDLMPTVLPLFAPSKG
jgi:hypothetical protein